MLTKPKIVGIHTDLQATLNAFAAKHGLTLSPIRLSWDEKGFTSTLRMGDKSETGDADPLFAKVTAAYGRWYGLSVDDIGKRFKYNEVPVVFEGLRTKLFAIIRHKDGRRYKVKAEDFARANKRVGIMSK